MVRARHIDVHGRERLRTASGIVGVVDAAHRAYRDATAMVSTFPAEAVEPLGSRCETPPLRDRSWVLSPAQGGRCVDAIAPGLTLYLHLGRESARYVREAYFLQ